MEKMNLDFLSYAFTIVVVFVIVLLLWISFMFAKNTSSGRYWLLIWIPMGWLVSLSLAELILQIIFESKYSIVSGWDKPHIILWIISFILLLLGFVPQFRPNNRSDRLNLLIFIICWTITMVIINLFWFKLIFS